MVSGDEGNVHVRVSRVGIIALVGNLVSSQEKSLAQLRCNDEALDRFFSDGFVTDAVDNSSMADENTTMSPRILRAFPAPD